MGHKQDTQELFNMARLAIMFIVFTVLHSACVTGAPQPNLPVTDCPTIVDEGNNVTCMCLPPLGQDANTYWGGSHSQTLDIQNVSKQQHGTQYVCHMKLNGGQDVTTIFTLKVSYGPYSKSTTISADHPTYTTQDAINKVPQVLNCNCFDVNPPPSYTWSGGPCENSLHESTCTFVPKIADNGTEVMCRVSDSAGANPPRDDEATYTIVISGDDVTNSYTSQTTQTTARDSGVGGSTDGLARPETTTNCGDALIKGSLYTITILVMSVFIALPV